MHLKGCVQLLGCTSGGGVGKIRILVKWKVFELRSENGLWFRNQAVYRFSIKQSAPFEAVLQLISKGDNFEEF